MIAGAGIVTLIRYRAGYARTEVDAGADAIGANVVDGVGVAVVASGQVLPVGIGADTVHLIADAHEVALVERGAGDVGAQVGAGADAIGANVVDRVCVAVVASGAVLLVGIGANTIRLIADARDVTLVERGAGDVGAEVSASADAAGAAITDGVGVAVVASRSVAL